MSCDGFKIKHVSGTDLLVTQISTGSAGTSGDTQGAKWHEIGVRSMIAYVCLPAVSIEALLERFVSQGLGDLVIVIEGDFLPKAEIPAVDVPSGYQRGTTWPIRRLSAYRITDAMEPIGKAEKSLAHTEFVEHLAIFDQGGLVLEWYDVPSGEIRLFNHLGRSSV